VPVRLATLPRTPEALEVARALLVRALPFDRVDVVCEEKLFGADAARKGRSIGAFDGDRLVGVLAMAGRWIKILAVDPAHRRRGVGKQLFDEALFSAGGALRVGDHPGNYLSPGVDERYEEGLRFLVRHGFVERERVENLRVPYAANPLCTPSRTAQLVEGVATRGYRIARPSADEIGPLGDLVRTHFANVWAFECERAFAGPRRALFAAFDTAGAPVAFAAADGNNQGLGWFGPAGTLPEHRGKGLGEALLLSCLSAVAGLPEAGVIAWIGPKTFYTRAAGAREDRRFVQLERPL
jgi:GNAT superfamily N-acetyltransferase